MNVLPLAEEPADVQSLQRKLSFGIGTKFQLRSGLRKKWIKASGHMFFFLLHSFCTDRLLDAFEKLRRETAGFVVCVRPSAWNISAPSERIFVKFHI